LNRAALLIPVIAGATMILTAACGGAAAPTNTPAPPTPAATSAPAPTTPPGGNGGGDPVAQGEALVQSNGCLACHSTDGSVLVGPSWQGVYGSQETLTDGTTVTVDDEYIQESIVDPNAKIVEGFQPNLMPQNFGDTLSESDIEAIIAYIKSLQ
jgi:cytochrome c551/c552